MDLFRERTGFPVALVAGQLAEAERRGLLERDHLQLRASSLGRRFLNDLLALFLPPSSESRPERPAAIVAFEREMR